uniref:Uncharacterized protein n=1 Tax=Arundo donax TaxID=35708 RepID=A0A0A9D402_ARUDO
MLATTTTKATTTT